MILIKITNASEVVAMKAGKFLEQLTPDKIDQNLVESQVIQQMIEQLSLEGLKGEISLIKGIDVEKDKLITTKEFSIKDTHSF